jgi:putative flavoprotein involved in K+ transport
VQTNTEVFSVTPDHAGYRIETSRVALECATLVLASGTCNIASVPAMADEMPAKLQSMTPITYKRPDDLPQGGVLIVGGSATGVQLARELQVSGRQVTLSVGEHGCYTARDIRAFKSLISK